MTARLFRLPFRPACHSRRAVRRERASRLEKSKTGRARLSVTLDSRSSFHPVRNDIVAFYRVISVPAPWSVSSSSSTACGTLPSMMTTPSTPRSMA